MHISCARVHCLLHAPSLACVSCFSHSHAPSLPFSPLALSLMLVCTISRARMPCLLCSCAPSLAFVCPVSPILSRAVSCAHVHHLSCSHAPSLMCVSCFLFPI